MFTLVKVEGFRNKNLLVKANFTLNEIIAEISSLDSINNILLECEIFNILSRKDFSSDKEGNMVAFLEGDNGSLTITVIYKCKDNSLEL